MCGCKSCRGGGHACRGELEAFDSEEELDALEDLVEESFDELEEYLAEEEDWISESTGTCTRARHDELQHATVCDCFENLALAAECRSVWRRGLDLSFMCQEQERMINDFEKTLTPPWPINDCISKSRCLTLQQPR